MAVTATASTAASPLQQSGQTLSSSPSPRPDRTLENLRFDNLALRALPIDKVEKNHVRQVPNAIYSRVATEPVKNPMVVALSEEAMDLFDVPPSELQEEKVAQYFSGNKLLPGSETYSHCYCGHQFGAFSGQLGDGAAISLGEVVNRRGERWELQLKGAGPTPYSRRADGRKVLRSSVREFLCSEGMFFLGVPTTRAGVVATSDSVTPRDPYYNGNVIMERCSVVLRLAPTFLRFGSFEIFKHEDQLTGRAGPSAGNYKLQKELLDHVLNTYFPEIASMPGSEVERYKALYRKVVVDTARMVAKWQCVGFVHGVLNTDNMSILGLTIDYGPFGFLEAFDPDFIPNGSDNTGRYTYEKQPEICRWNCFKFAEALHPTLPLDQSTSILNEVYDKEFYTAYMEGMRAKLGLLEPKEGDEQLIKDLLGVMEETHADFTDTFLALQAFDGSNPDEAVDRLVSVCASPSTVASLMTKKLRIARPTMPPGQVQALWQLAETQPERLSEIFFGNVEAVKEELRGEMEKIKRAEKLANGIRKYQQMQDEEKKAQDKELWKAFIPKLAHRITNENANAENNMQRRAEVMAAANPTFILRNWIAQDAIEAAEKTDFSRVRTVLKMLKKPYATPEGAMVCSRKDDDAELVNRYKGRAPDWAASLVCTCSS